MLTDTQMVSEVLQLEQVSFDTCDPMGEQRISSHFVGNERITVAIAANP
jgi:hypothetical protein